MRRILSIVLALSLLGAARTGEPWAQQQPAMGAHAMVATAQHYATKVGVDVLRGGGNAIDAAVAVGYALAVVHPCCGNIGGGGFMLVRLHDGRERFIDFRETAPRRARSNMYLDAHGNVVARASTRGYLSAGVPGTVMGLDRALSEFGTRSRAAMIAPAAALAQNGYRIDPGDASVFDGADDAAEGPYRFSAQPNVRAIFMRAGRLPQAGDLIVQPQLAATLRLIARDGDQAFYKGPIAHAVVAASERNGGILSLADFAGYRVRETQPLHCRYRGYTITSAPPPSSGGTTLCEILNVTSGYPLGSWGWNSRESAHYVVEAERRAYADRNEYLGDPSFVQNPLTQLLSQTYAAHVRSQIDPRQATPSVDVHPGLGPVAFEHTDTTHYSIVDRWGNAVAVTYTINDDFGARVIAGNTGFLLNDEMDDFTSKPGVPNLYGLVQGVRNGIQPGKRPLSSMAPTIVTRNGKVFMVTGSPGGSRIITIALSTIENAIDYGMNVQQAVNAPRIHMQWLPDAIEYEPGALSPQTIAALRSEGYRFRERAQWGTAEAVVVDAAGVRYGGTVRRAPQGLAAGY
jgi:gamma-glutamyltranspeptidase/glutathione hydrolase